MTHSSLRILQPVEASRLLQELPYDEPITMDSLMFPSGYEWPLRNYAHWTFRNVRFPRVSFQGSLLRRIVFRNCQFERVCFEESHLVRAEFDNCIFSSVRFEGTEYGRVAAAVFLECRFTDSVIARVFMNDVTLQNCHFDRVDVYDVNWRECSFNRVIMSGRVRFSSFIDSAFRNTDLSALRLIDVSFVGGHPDDRRMPDRPDNFVVDGRVFATVKTAVRERLSRSGYEAFVREADVILRDPLEEVIDETTFDFLGDADKRVVMQALYENRRRNDQSNVAEPL